VRRSFTRELVIGFGFLNGLWAAIGVSPEEWIFTFLKPYISNLPVILRVIFAIIPTILLIITIYNIFKIYKKGKLLGIISVILAFVAGTLVFTNWIVTIVLLVVAMIVGAIGFRGQK
jgi:chromate transport protein ChrA